jgi:hypothetical protein
VKNKFQSLPFKCNLQRYIAELRFEVEGLQRLLEASKSERDFLVRRNEVGLCTLNQVDPCPITCSLSNP